MKLHKKVFNNTIQNLQTNIYSEKMNPTPEENYYPFLNSEKFRPYKQFMNNSLNYFLEIQTISNKNKYKRSKNYITCSHKFFQLSALNQILQSASKWHAKFCRSQSVRHFKSF